MKTGNNRYLVKVTGLLNDHIITESGMKIYKDLTVGNKEWNKKTDGVIVQIPEKHTHFMTKAPDLESYRDGKYRRVLFHDRLPIVLRPNDKVYFNYLALRPEARLTYDGYNPSEFLFLIYGDDIQAYEREGQFYANAGRAILEHIKEDQVKSTRLIIPKAFQRKALNIGRVLANGLPWKGYSRPEAEVGDLVVYAKGEGDYLTEDKKRFAIYHQSMYLVVKNI